ncbi:hypothetical protein [Brochothrix thermosphacta]|uniref:DUF3885 domain-containing protein n=1 Tax=Brochothrix thermosphacta TaxID=2756 RepID=UPI0039B10EA7
MENLKMYMSNTFGVKNMEEPSYFDSKYVIHTQLEKDLSTSEGEKTNVTYLKNVYSKGEKIFHSIFEKKDDIVVIINVEMVKGRYSKLDMIRKFFRNINKYDMKYEKNKSNTFEDIDIHTFYLNVQKENIADQYIISAICNQDFPPLIPKLKKRNVEGVNFLFVNKTKHTLLHIYDDRGAYILTSNSEDYDYYTNLYREDLFIEEE